MPEIKIDHFIAYLTYNNNGGQLYYDPADGSPEGDRKIQVDYSTDGLAIFRHRYASFEQKLEFYRELQKGLIEEFGKGFSLAFAPHSDCSLNHEMAQFCKFMKDLNPDIKTVIHGSGTNFIPQDVGKTLTDFYNAEPYRSASRIANEGVEILEGCQTAKLDKGIDYVTSGFGADTSGLIRDLLQIDLEKAPEHNVESDDYVSVDPKTINKIQEIANKAFEIAMQQKPSAAPSLDISGLT